MTIKRLLGLVLILVSVQVFGQNPTNYTLRNTRERVISFMVDSMLRIPRYNGTPSGVRVNETSAIDGAIAMDTTNGRMYIFSGNAWVRLANYSEVGTTPTWQQTLTAGSRLTTANSINGAGNDFTWDSLGNYTQTVRGANKQFTFETWNSSGLQTSDYEQYDGGIYMDARHPASGNSTSLSLESYSNGGTFEVIDGSTYGNFFLTSYGSSSLYNSEFYLEDHSSTNYKYTGLYQNIGVNNNTTFNTYIENAISNKRYNRIYLDSANGIAIATKRADALTYKGLRVDHDHQVYVDSMATGGVAADSVVVITSGGQLKKRNASAFTGVGSTKFGKSGEDAIGAEHRSFDAGGYSFSIGSATEIGLAADSVTLVSNGGATVWIDDTTRTDKRIGYTANLGSTFTQYSLVDKGYVDSLKLLSSLQQDTISLASFGAGGGQAGDTTSFSTSTIYGSFYNDGSDTLIITSIRSVVQGTSASITPTVYYNDSLNVTAGATKLVNSPSALTNTAVGVSSTPDNQKIPPGVWVWVKTETVTTKPTYFSLTLIGYKKRK